MSASAEDPPLVGEDQSEGSGGSGAGQDGELLVKPDAICDDRPRQAKSHAGKRLICMHACCVTIKGCSSVKCDPKGDSIGHFG